MKELIPQERIECKIFVIRGQKVMLSTHLAQLYEVEPKVLIQAVKRNIKRFPEDFMFRLTWKETNSLKSQFVTLKNSSKAIFSLHYQKKQQMFAKLGAFCQGNRIINTKKGRKSFNFMTYFCMIFY